MLDFKVRGENIEVTDAIQDYIEKRLTRLEKYLNDDNKYVAHVNVRSYKEGNHKIEVTIQLPYLLLRAEDTQQDLYQAVDFVSEKLERQIRKYKTKVNRKSREKGYKGLEQLDFVPEAETDVLEDDESAIEIVRTKHVSVKPMDAEEAVLQMELLGHNFFVFQDAESGVNTIVYKRKDGKYALLDAQGE
jgi:ribosomal subunit interface protein